MGNYIKAYGVKKHNLKNIDICIPKGKNIWGSVTINERGQLVIPKNVREMFGLSGGQRLIVLTDDKEGIALIPAKLFEDKMKHAMEFASVKPEE